MAVIRRLLRWLAVTAVVVGLSCGNVGVLPKGAEIPTILANQYVRHIYLAPTFSAEEVAMIVEAAKRWETATVGAVTLIVHTDEILPDRVDEETLIYVTRALSTDPIGQIVEKLRGPDAPGVILGWTFQHRIVTTVVLFGDHIRNKYVFTQLVVHELGHTLGIQHIDERHGAVMYPMMDGATNCPTKLDLEALCDIYGCDVSEMAPCTASLPR